ncbi:23S rRNA (uracil(1939)-C(5))-methyltransferase RlmD [Atopobium fossor]|uniref:23S rRNA (uracil(1939)-C(5))-methyltransferase RlmD n=1 Tax=Atopobium fossor TaxID=39487 RepID=UPI000427F02B|nr:23S rRNA (uracil(1939)-C(5))-methyltransferase RlmD [Atopobium fossor]
MAENLTLKIERMTYGTDAIAHDTNGKTIFVSGAVVGDTVEARITASNKTFSKAQATKILKTGPYHRDAACSTTELASGCPWAQISYEQQLIAKRTNVVDSLVRIGHFDPFYVEDLVDVCNSPSYEWEYRNKLELGFERTAGRARLGVRAFNTNELIKLEQTMLLPKPLSKLPKSISGALSYLSNSHNLSFMRIGIRASKRTKDVEVALWTEPGPFPRAQAARVLNDAAKLTSVVRVMSKGPTKARKIAGVERLSGKGYWTEKIGNETMYISAPSFFQVNTKGAERLVELVLEGLKPQAHDVAMDLYSGAGTFTLPLARVCSFVYAVESYGPAVKDLHRNIEKAKLDNIDAAGGDAARKFPEDEADIIVVDPPRAGLAPEVVDLLGKQPARAIAYVSCDPATLARDLARFAADGNFKPVRITPVDLFPQTFHVETVTILSRVKNKA